MLIQEAVLEPSPITMTVANRHQNEASRIRDGMAR
jgi:hypothetical protein